MKYLLLLLVNIVNIGYLFGQCTPNSDLLSKCKDGKKEINNLVLYRSTFTKESEGYTHTQGYDVENFSGFEKIHIYTDTVGRIRKYHSIDDGQGYLQSTIAYYDESGGLIYAVFVDDDAERNSGLSGYIYANNGSVVYLNIHTVDDRREINRDYIRCIGKLPMTIGSFSLKYDIHVENLKKRIPIAVTTNTMENRITFSHPQKGCMTTVKANGVRIRTEDSIDSSVIGIINAGYQVRVVDIGRQEKLNGISYPYFWYKIESLIGSVGYIFGAFLEPIEQIITE